MPGGMATARTARVPVGLLADRLVQELHKARGKLLIAGVLSLIAGGVAILVPAVASVATAIFIGWILVLSGVLQTFEAVSARRWVRLVLAALTLAAGAYLLVAPLQGTFTLTVILVLWFVAAGAFRIAIGATEWGLPGSGVLVVIGALDLLLGLLIAEQLPDSADWAIGLLVGIDLVFTGVFLISLSRALARV
jgi:uncharacterized membrane protein HdeD (DUF308 family)